MTRFTRVPAVFMLALASAPLVRAAGTGAFDCGDAISYFLSFEAREASRISPQNPITILLAEDAYFLEYETSRKLTLLPPDKRAVCLKTASDTDEALVAYFRARFELLLSQPDLARFYVEMGNLLAPRLGEAKKSDILARLGGVEARYLEAVRSSLMNDLAGTPWAAYRAIPMELETWNAEWLSVLGREAPAAVRLDSGRIALRPLDFPPAELKVFLFHELSHLADPEPRGGANFEVANERFAWAATVQYLDFLRASVARIPPLFERVALNIRLLGLDAWVRNVVETRDHAILVHP